MWMEAGAVALGAAGGALLRWWLAVLLNSLHISIQTGTLAANWLGALLMGLCLGFFLSRPELPPHWRLLVLTGFLGGLTTFSTFSAEAVAMLQQQRYTLLLFHIGLHVLGSLALTALGLWLTKVFKP